MELCRDGSKTTPSAATNTLAKRLRRVNSKDEIRHAGGRRQRVQSECVLVMTTGGASEQIDIRRDRQGGGRDSGSVRRPRRAARGPCRDTPGKGCVPLILPGAWGAAQLFRSLLGRFRHPPACPRPRGAMTCVCFSWLPKRVLPERTTFQSAGDDRPAGRAASTGQHEQPDPARYFFSLHCSTRPLPLPP